jgi:hypothetical protein
VKSVDNCKGLKFFGDRKNFSYLKTCIFFKERPVKLA